MGGHNWTDDAYKNISSTYSGKTAAQVFHNTATRTLSNGMDPKGLKFRESRDSDVHPNSLAIMTWLDETGSMGRIPEHLVRENLPNLMQVLLDNGVQDAHVLFGGVGDHYSDHYPLQVGQFEAGADQLLKWLTEINLEGNGGGQGMESYLLAWLVAARHTSVDCFEKRGKKGFLFTIGDEYVHDRVEAGVLKNLLGYENPEDVTAAQLLTEAQRMYHVFHIHCTHGKGGNYYDHISNDWKKLLGERLIVCVDFTKIPEIIATTVAVVNGADLNKVVSGFDEDTKALVLRSTSNAINSITNTTANTGVIKL